MHDNMRFGIVLWAAIALSACYHSEVEKDIPDAAINAPVGGNCGWHPCSSDYVCGGSGYDPEGEPNICPNWLEPGVRCNHDSEREFSWCCNGSVSWRCSAEGYVETVDCGPDPGDVQNPVQGNCGWLPWSCVFKCGGSGYDPSGDLLNVCPKSMEEGMACEPMAMRGCCDGSVSWKCSDEGLMVSSECGP